MAETWNKWIPASGLSEKYTVDSIHNLIGRFEVHLFENQNSTNKIKIIWGDSLDIHGKTNISPKSKFIIDLQEAYGSDFIDRWTFFKIENSDYLKWLSKESSEWSNVMSFEHFVILGSDSVIDVVTNYEPKVEFIDVEEGKSSVQETNDKTILDNTTIQHFDSSDIHLMSDEPENEKIGAKSVDDLIAESKPCRETKGRTTYFDKFSSETVD